MGGGVRVGSNGADLSELDVPPRPGMMSMTPQLPSLPGEGLDEYGLTVPDWDADAAQQRYGMLRSGLQGARANRLQDAQLGPPESNYRLVGKFGEQFRPGNTPGTSSTVTQESMRAPTMRPGGSTVTGTMPTRQQQAWNLAKMLGFEIGDTPENAEVVSRAFAKLTKGMPVAQLLNPKNRAKVTQMFNQLLTQEAGKLQQPATGQFRPSPGEEVPQS